jgi:hypothetical protein
MVEAASAAVFTSGISAAASERERVIERVRSVASLHAPISSAVESRYQSLIVTEVF